VTLPRDPFKKMDLPWRPLDSPFFAPLDSDFSHAPSWPDLVRRERDLHRPYSPVRVVSRRFITGEDVQALPEGAILDLPKDAVLTDIAREWIAKKRIRVVTPGSSVSSSPERARVALGSDHAGFNMKEELKAFLTQENVSFIDFGTYSTEAVDYPDFAHAVALAVAVGRTELGILVDGAGIGSAIAANKVPGVRAAACHDEASARNSREHNDANVLTLGARAISKEAVTGVVRAFLNSQITEERHRRRVRKVTRIERKYYRGV
jgi:ribose 5-phosphate isomerase B